MEKSIAYFLYQKEGDLMYNFNYYTPTKVVFGKNTEDKCGELVKESNDPLRKRKRQTYRIIG